MTMNESTDSLLAKAKNKFLLSNAVGQRAKQIAGGSLPYINNFDPSNPIITAIREISAEKIKIKLEASPKKKKAEELLVEEVVPNALERLAKEKKAKPKKEKKK